MIIQALTINYRDDFPSDSDNSKKDYASFHFAGKLFFTIVILVNDEKLINKVVFQESVNFIREIFFRVFSI